ncbi:hypothetical protein ACF0H5_010273 [Mactra antiquata]
MKYINYKVNVKSVSRLSIQQSGSIQHRADKIQTDNLRSMADNAFNRNNRQGRGHTRQKDKYMKEEP